MTASAITLTSFVRGMAWHDIAKPFFLNGQQHSRFGMVLLEACKYNDEATVALAHYRPLDSLLLLFKEREQASVPATLAITNALDRLSASAYALADLKTSGTEMKWSQTMQNPFTRIPIASVLAATEQYGVATEGLFQALDNDGRGKGPEAARSRGLPNLNNLCQEHFKAFLQPDDKRETAGFAASLEQISKDKSALPALSNEISDFSSWRHRVVEEARKVTPDFWLDAAANAQTQWGVDHTRDEEQALLALLLHYSDLYPERTYAPANDTSLSSHTRLAALLAFVVWKNLEHNDPEFLTKTITRHDSELVFLPGKQSVAEFVRHIPQLQPGFNDAESLVRDNSSCNIVRIVFSGYRELYETAVRLDDLRGARQLIDRIRAAFKFALAAELDVPELAHILPLSETPFELYYLLPDAVVNDIEVQVATAYATAIDQIITAPDDGLLRLLQEDFQKTYPPLPFAEDIDGLRQQLTAVVYGLSVEPVSVAVTDSFRELSRQFGQRLLKAFRKASKEAAIPVTMLRAIAEQMAADDDLAIDELCLACEVNPAYTPFSERIAADAYLQKVTHAFRDDPEPLCLTCITRRVLSHARTEIPLLEDLINAGFNPDTSKVQIPIAGAVSLPPSLRRSALCRRIDDPEDPYNEDVYVDLGAAFIRRSRKNANRLDVFPTIAYAADAESNVALLTLVPTTKLFKAYHYKRAVGKQRKKLDTTAWSAYFDEGFGGFYAAMRTKDKDKSTPAADSVLTVKPHIARVLERIRRLDTFYKAVRLALEQTGIRVLPLDEQYPTLRLLLPAAQLADALAILDGIVARELFSITDGRMPDDEWLRAIVPQLLIGSAVIFKQKQAIYLVLDAEKQLLKQVRHASKKQIAATTVLPEGQRWQGLRLGFTDLRGTLTEYGAWQAQTTSNSLSDLLNLSGRVDRTSIDQFVTTAHRSGLDASAQMLAEAQLYIRGAWTGLTLAENEALIQPATYLPLYFLKRVTRQSYDRTKTAD